MWVTIGEKDTAESLGFGAGLTWETVWSAPENAPLRNGRREGLVLNPGDRLFIPDRRQQWKDAPIDRRSRFRRQGVPSKIRLKIEVNEQPEEGVPYVLEIDKRRIEGFVPASGIIEHWVRPDQDDGVLWVGRGSTRRRYPLKLRELRPLDTVAGVQNRLCNRGYPVAVTGEMNDETRHRLRLFQSERGLPVTGEPDEATQAALKDRHGI
ncbi:MAG: peptidoglycan-binding domain-containing protein [Bryobacteraceae bacterium]